MLWRYKITGSILLEWRHATSDDVICSPELQQQPILSILLGVACDEHGVRLHG